MKKFFLVGPPRTGTTLLARCLSDHPNCICLFESNAHVYAFGGTRTVGHSGRMKRHGFSSEQTKCLRARITKKNIESLFSWYDECANILCDLYDKPQLTHIGDKNPFFHTSPGFIKSVSNCLKIWTIRDPRAVWCSKKGTLFNAYLNNIRFFLPLLVDPSFLVVRFEDLVAQPKISLEKIHSFLGLKSSEHFLHHKPSKYDCRFHWNPNSLDNFDSTKLNSWKTQMIPKRVTRLKLVKKIMRLFNYD